MTAPSKHQVDDLPPVSGLVEESERALRAWLAPGRHRPGDRLPPEQDLARMLGVSRGTLRAALERLEASGLIVRRRGSGTFVGELPLPGTFDAGLERLEPYSALASRQGLGLGARDVRITREPVHDVSVATALGLEPGAYVLSVTRTMTANGSPVAWMLDTVSPAAISLDDDVLLERLLAGAMVMDVLVEAGVPVAFARTEVDARTLGEDARFASVLGGDRRSSALILTETMHLSDGTPVQHSVNAFAPGRLRLHIMRSTMDAAPAEL
jgi:GntR family transcriptional regulator